MKNRPMIDSLTGLRGFAAVVVMLHHFSLDPAGTFDWGAAEPLLAQGNYGVDLFFVLSGFIISHVYAASFRDRTDLNSLWRFIALRFARIWPVHILTLLVALALVWVAAQLGRLPKEAEVTSLDIAANIAMVQAWFGLKSPNVPAWSVSAEWFAYLVFPLLVRLLYSIPSWGLVCVAAAALAVLQYAGLGHDVPLTRVTCAFTCGMIVHAFAPRFEGYAGLAVATALVGLLALPYVSTGVFPSALIGMFCLLVVGLSFPRQPGSALLASPALVALGEMSYSLYLVHVPCAAVMKQFVRLLPLDLPVNHPLAVAIFSIVAIAIAWGCYRFVELPARAGLRWLVEPVVAGRALDRT